MPSKDCLPRITVCTTQKSSPALKFFHLKTKKSPPKSPKKTQYKHILSPGVTKLSFCFFHPPQSTFNCMNQYLGAGRQLREEKIKKRKIVTT